jgi:DtxR family transcriptional regulator, Mn-dependent transcriptional regulator
VTNLTDRDEMLERLWQLGERGSPTRAALRDALKGRFRDEDLRGLAADGLAALAGEGITLTPAGTALAARLIRAHRIGERLIHDVLGRDFESGACELEHIMATEVVDGICTLLGHPRECPHGFPIPQGECCRASALFARKVIVPLSEIDVGQSARVAYVYTRNDQQLHRLASLQIRPGMAVKLHQVSPSYVIECDGASIALDTQVANAINVWVESGPTPGEDHAADGRGPASGRTEPPPHGRWRFSRRRG